MVYKRRQGDRPSSRNRGPRVVGAGIFDIQSAYGSMFLCIKFSFYMSLCGLVMLATDSRNSSLNSSRSPSVIAPSLIIRQMIGRGSDPLMDICTPTQRLSSRMRLHNFQNLSASEPSPRNNSIYSLFSLPIYASCHPAILFRNRSQSRFPELPQSS